VFGGLESGVGIGVWSLELSQVKGKMAINIKMEYI
jgi:hypothetical protein